MSQPREPTKARNGDKPDNRWAVAGDPGIGALLADPLEAQTAGGVKEISAKAEALRSPSKPGARHSSSASR